MALPKRYDDLEDGLTIAAEIVSACTGVPVIGTVTTVAIKKLIEEFSSPTLKLNDVLNKKTIKTLNIPDGKFDFIFEQTRFALRSINYEDYNSSLFKQHVFTKNCFNPVTISDEIIGSLELGEEERSDVLKAVRFVLAIYLLRWTEEPDFSLETRQKLQHVESALEKVDDKFETLDKKINEKYEDQELIINNHEGRLNKLENHTTLIPIELTVIPRSITTLIGRESVIQDVTSKLETDHILCMSADGGLGKTAIAKNIINTIRDHIGGESCKYKHVAWLTSSGNLKEDLLQINIPDLASNDQEDKYINICRFLQSNPTFLVIDNMDELPTPDEINILNTIAGESNILITTRAMSDNFPSYELHPLDRDTAVVLFYHYYFHNPAITNITHEKIKNEMGTGRIVDAYKIVETTGRNALTIELLAKTAYADVLSLNELWKRFSSGTSGFESKTKVQTDHSSKHNVSMLSSDEQMRTLYSMLKLSDRQKEIMSFISLFPAEHDIFSDVFKWAGFFDQDANDMMHLVDRGWIIREDNYFSIHTIVRDSIILQNSKNRDTTSILNYEGLIKELSNIDNYIPRTTEFSLAQKLSFVPQTVGKLLSKKFTSNTLIGTFFNNLADLYFNQGNYNEALKFYNLALVIREKTLGQDHPDTATTYNNIAGAYETQGNYDDALRFLNMSLDIREKILGKDHPDTATTYNDIACIYGSQGNYDDALKFYNMALDIREKILGKDHPDTATTYNDIAYLFQKQSNYDDALKFYNMALDIREKTLGQNHPETAITYNNIASVYQDQNDYDGALKVYNIALEIKLKTIGKYHPSTAITYSNIAGVYENQGNYDEALKFYDIALEINEKILGKDHPNTVTTYNRIAGVYKAQENYDDALKFYKMALEIREKILGKDHPDTATTYFNIAIVYKEQENYDDAMKFYNMALEIREKNLGRDHPETAKTYNNLAGVYVAKGNYDIALKFYNIALTFCEKKLGIHSNTALVHGNLAVLYRKMGDHEESQKHADMAKEIRKKLGDK